MNVDQATKAKALADRPGGELVRIGSLWAVVWPEGDSWVGQTFTGGEEKIWWRPEDRAATKRALVKGLKETQ